MLRKINTAIAVSSSFYVLYSIKQRQQLFKKLPHTPAFTESKVIYRENMLEGHWQDLQDTQIYDVTIARKKAFENRWQSYNPLVHAVLAIQPDPQKMNIFYLADKAQPWHTLIRLFQMKRKQKN